MRKFNLKGKVAQKLKGLETAVPENPTADAGAEASQAQPETVVTEHGEIRYVRTQKLGVETLSEIAPVFPGLFE